MKRAGGTSLYAYIQGIPKYLNVQAAYNENILFTKRSCSQPPLGFRKKKKKVCKSFNIQCANEKH